MNFHGKDVNFRTLDPYETWLELFEMIQMLNFFSVSCK